MAILVLDYIKWHRDSNGKPCIAKSLVKCDYCSYEFIANKKTIKNKEKHKCMKCCHKYRIDSWTDSEIQILKNLYPANGPKFLSPILKKSARAIAMKAHNLNIKTIKSAPIEDNFLNEFYNITKPEIAYFLGYFWADGCISDKNNNIMFGIVEKDGEQIKNLLLSIIPFHISIHRPKARPHVQKTMTFRKGDSNLHHFLKEYDYHIKSDGSPVKILQKIPESLHNFWWQGYLDGDGNIYLNKTYKNTHPRVNFVGPRKQDWNFYENLCKKLEIKFQKLESNNKLGGWSHVYVQTIAECRKLLDYIYKDGSIGLKRKYDKYLELKESVKIPDPKTSKYIGVCKKALRETKNWYAFACHRNKFHSIGFYFTEDDAARARDKFVVDNNLPLKLNFKD